MKEKTGWTEEELINIARNFRCDFTVDIAVHHANSCSILTGDHCNCCPSIIITLPKKEDAMRMPEEIITEPSSKEED